MKKKILLLLSLVYTLNADWYYYVMKIDCSNNKIKIIDYSAANEEGEARGKEAGAINVDKLSTWRTTADELRVPDKPLPHVQTCSAGEKKYKIILTNESSGGYSAPYPIVNVFDITNAKTPKQIYTNFAITQADKRIKEIIFSSNFPTGKIVYK